MADTASFDELLARARSGEESAMAALVEQYEPEVRMVARIRLVTYASMPRSTSAVWVTMIPVSLLSRPGYE